MSKPIAGACHVPTIDQHHPTSSTAATKAPAAPGAGWQHVLLWVAYSTTGTIAAGTNLTVNDGTTDLVKQYLPTTATAEFLDFRPDGLPVGDNKAMTITVSDPGDSGTAALNFAYVTVETGN